MIVIINGISYSIVRIDPLESGDHVAAYQIFLIKR